VRAAVRTIPDGVYEAGSFIDDDGVALGEHIPIHVRVGVRREGITFDLSGVGAQVAGYFNFGSTAGRSACEVALTCLTTPLSLPINEGSFRPLMQSMKHSYSPDADALYVKHPRRDNLL